MLLAGAANTTLCQMGLYSIDFGSILGRVAAIEVPGNRLKGYYSTLLGVLDITRLCHHQGSRPGPIVLL